MQTKIFKVSYIISEVLKNEMIKITEVIRCIIKAGFTLLIPSCGSRNLSPVRLFSSVPLILCLWIDIFLQSKNNLVRIFLYG